MDTIKILGTSQVRLARIGPDAESSFHGRVGQRPPGIGMINPEEVNVIVSVGELAVGGRNDGSRANAWLSSSIACRNVSLLVALKLVVRRSDSARL